MAPHYSVVVPVLDEAGVLDELYRRVSEVLDSLDGPWELIFVDDGSRDGSYEVMRDLNDADSRVKIVRLSRSFGKEGAVTAGLDFVHGDAAIVMDADLQHPPEVIPELVRRWRDGHEVVYAVKDERSADEGRVKRWTASAFYSLAGRLTDIDVPQGSDFRLVDRRALEAFRSMRERSRYVRGLFSWIGFDQTGIPYTPAVRGAGTTKFTLPRMVSLGSHGILGFSRTPLHIALALGFFVSLLAVGEAAYAIVDKAGGFGTAPGWASIVVVVSLLGGMQLIVLGFIGEYVGLIYDEVKARPIYVVRGLHGFEEEA